MIKSAYAFRSLENEAINSTSGGAFISIAKNFFYEHADGIVYGVALFEDKTVSYDRATTFDECKKFQGSKYVFCSINTVIESIKVDLKNNKSVLVSGLPCQLYSLKKHLCQQNVNCSSLTLIDILCHGTPDAKKWNDYVVWLENKYASKIVDYSFRYKNARWKNYPSMALLENGETKINTFEVRMFNSLFLSGLIIRNGCFKCPFASSNRVGDISLGDFWGIKYVMPDFSRNHPSLILVGSIKGEQLIHSLKGNFEIKKCPNNKYMEFQHNLHAPTEKPKEWEEFQEDYSKNGIEFCLKKYMAYNNKGRIVFFIKKVLNESGIVSMIRRIR